MGAAVHGDVIHFALGHADQLALRVVLLEVQTAQHAAGGAALVVLHELFVDAGFCELILLIRLHEIAAVIAEHLRLNDHNTGDLGLRKSKFAHISFPLCFLLKIIFFLLYMKSPEGLLHRVDSSPSQSRFACQLPQSGSPWHIGQV